MNGLVLPGLLASYRFNIRITTAASTVAATATITSRRNCFMVLPPLAEAPHGKSFTLFNCQNPQVYCVLSATLKLTLPPTKCASSTRMVPAFPQVGALPLLAQTAPEIVSVVAAEAVRERALTARTSAAAGVKVRVTAPDVDKLMQSELDAVMV